MKVKALVGGFDGVDSYEAGDRLEGDSEHIRTLLFNDAAEPLDKAAKAFVDARSKLSAKQVKEHRNYVPAIAESAAAYIKEAAKVKKVTKKQK